MSRDPRARPFPRFVSALVAACVFASAVHAPSARATIFPTVFPPFVMRCSRILEPVVTAVDALPFLRRFLDRKLSQGWLERFDFKLYLEIRARYAKMETLPLEQWDFPEASLAYLEVLMERAGGFKLKLADSILDDPTRARRLQLLLSEVDLTKPLTRYELRRLVENAYLVDGRLNLKLAELRNLDTKRVRKVMREHVHKEIAKKGVLDFYTEMGFLQEKERFGQTLLRLYEHPLVSAAMYVPTWTEIASVVPGFLPPARWVRVSPRDLEKFLEVGVDAHLPNVVPSLKRGLAVQTTYDFAQTFVAVWISLLTLGYAARWALGLDEEETEKLVLQSAIPAFAELRREYERKSAPPASR